MMRRYSFKSCLPTSRQLVAIGLIAAVGLGAQPAKCDSNATASKLSAAIRSSEMSDPAWHFAVERTTPPAAEQTTSGKTSGSLILMELRAHRAGPQGKGTTSSDADPRTRPLGW